MKLPCELIKDILPIYYDGVCSSESARLVEEHLTGCPECHAVLENLRTEIKVNSKKLDELKPLKEIEKRWHKSKRTSVKKGMCIMLALILVLATVMTGIWYFSYGRYYYKLTGNMEKTPDEDAFFTSSDYTVINNGYRFEVWLPIVLSNSGFARVISDDGMIMFVYPEFGGSVDVSVIIDMEDGSFIKVWLNHDLTPNFKDHSVPFKTEEEKNEICALLEDKRNDIIDMFDAIREIWDIYYYDAT